MNDFYSMVFSQPFCVLIKSLTRVFGKSTYARLDMLWWYDVNLILGQDQHTPMPSVCISLFSKLYCCCWMRQEDHRLRTWRPKLSAFWLQSWGRWTWIYLCCLQSKWPVHCHREFWQVWFVYCMMLNHTRLYNGYKYIDEIISKLWF